MEARRQPIGRGGDVPFVTHCRPSEGEHLHGEATGRPQPALERRKVAAGTEPKKAPSPRTRSGVHSAARGMAGASCRSLAARWTPDQVRGDGGVGRSYACSMKPEAGPVCGGHKPQPYAPTCAGTTQTGDRNRAQKAPSPRTRSGGHSAARGMAGASCRPLAARWTPDRVRGDGVGAATAIRVADA